MRRDLSANLAMSRGDIAWLAGIVEGEGTISNRIQVRNGYSSHPVAIQIQMTDKDVMERVARLLGRKMYASPQSPPRKTKYRVSVSGPMCRSVMEAILPHMGKRRGLAIVQALLVPSFGVGSGKRPRTKHQHILTEAERNKGRINRWAQRLVIYAEVSP